MLGCVLVCFWFSNRFLPGQNRRGIQLSATPAPSLLLSASFSCIRLVCVTISVAIGHRLPIIHLKTSETSLYPLPLPSPTPSRPPPYDPPRSPSHPLSPRPPPFSRPSPLPLFTPFPLTAFYPSSSSPPPLCLPVPSLPSLYPLVLATLLDLVVQSFSGGGSTATIHGRDEDRNSGGELR